MPAIDRDGARSSRKKVRDRRRGLRLGLGSESESRKKVRGRRRKGKKTEKKEWRRGENALRMVSDDGMSPEIVAALKELLNCRSIAALLALMSACAETLRVSDTMSDEFTCQHMLHNLRTKLDELAGMHQTLACMSSEEVFTIAKNVESTFRSQCPQKRIVDSWNLSRTLDALRCDEWFSTHDKPELAHYKSKTQACHDRVSMVLSEFHPALIGMSKDAAFTRVRMNAATVATRCDRELSIQTTTGGVTTEYLLHIVRGSIGSLHAVVNLIFSTQKNASGCIHSITALQHDSEQWQQVTDNFVALMSKPVNSNSVLADRPAAR